MRTYPEHFDAASGLGEIKELLASFTHTQIAYENCIALRPSSNVKIVERSLQEGFEMQRLLQAIALPDLTAVDFIKDSLSQHRAIGTTPSIELLFKIKLLLKDTSLFLAFFDDIFSSFPALQYHRSKEQIPTRLFEYLQSILDDEGAIHPFASPLLRSLIDQIIQKEKEVRKLLQFRFEIARKNGWAGDTEITIRNDRLVIPIIAEHKKKVKGLVHDDSASGKYLYIEPIECFEENNRLLELYLAKKKEIERILRQAGLLLQEEAPALESLLTWWEKSDFIAAKAKLNNLLGAQMPEISNNACVRLKEMAHPLLLINTKQKEQSETTKIVKNSYFLHPEQRLMLLSGPNAGGKSVLLKTSILLQAMFQCGLGITAAKGSELYVFEQLFVEISDNQSIENALSTYSAHLVAMKHILTHATPTTFVVIDEMGTGTDPSLAAPLAEAMLESIVKTGALGIISSHLGNLKNTAETVAGIVNASMLYDPNELKPLYQLIVGRPGNSFAFELAYNLQFPEEILQLARQKMKETGNVDFESLQLKMEKLQFELETAQQKVADKEQHLQHLIQSYENLKQEIQNEKSVILKQAREEAAALLLEAKNTLQNIKKQKKQSPSLPSDEKTAMRNDLQKLEQKIEKQTAISNKQQSDATQPELLLNAPIHVGDWVYIQNSQQSGEVLELRKNKALISLGGLQTLVSLTAISKLKNQQKAKKNALKNEQSIHTELMEKQSSFKTTLDLRGNRADMALLKVEKWLDDAYLLGNLKLKLLHGKGEGVLKKFIWDYLKTHPHVKTWQFEHEELGGEGATLVELI